MPTIKKQNFILDVTSNTFEEQKEFTLDSRTEKVTKFALFSKRNDLLDQCGSLRLEINGLEIFPEKTDTKEFTTSVMVPVKDKFFDLSPYNVEAGNRSVKFKYKHDNSYATSAFVPYQIVIAFETVLK